MPDSRTYQLAKQLHRSCQSLELKGAMRDQLERALLSVPLNLAEGSARPSQRDRRRFYYIALGSLREVQAILDLVDAKELFEQADRLAAHLYRLCRSTDTATAHRTPSTADRH